MKSKLLFLPVPLAGLIAGMCVWLFHRSPDHKPRPTSSWEQGRMKIHGMPLEQVRTQKEQLFQIAEGDGVDAIRDAAISRLAELASAQPGDPEVVQRFCSQLPREPKAALRSSIVISLSLLYPVRQDTQTTILDSLRLSLRHDPDLRVRTQAIQGLATCDRNALRRALDEEQLDDETRAQGRISLALFEGRDGGDERRP